MAKTPAVSVKLYVQKQLVYSTMLTTSLELGRQRPDEVAPYTRVDDRAIIARLDESDISRQHVLLTLLAENRVRVTNQSTVNTILVGTDDKIQPSDSLDLETPILLTIFDRVLYLEPAGIRREGQEVLESFSHRTTPPGQRGISDSSILQVLAGDRNDEDNKYLLRGLHATIGAFQSASKSSDFMSRAAQAVIDITGLETAAALSWDGTDWIVEAISTRQGAVSDAQSEWKPSQAILQNVREEKRTFWRIPQIDLAQSPSLLDIRALVAAPILNSKSEVIGALYGDRRQRSAEMVDFGITEVDAMLVELLSTSVAAGLARLEQEKAAVKARVLFEQFFTPQLSEQLETEPNLLIGKDTEVTLLFCDIRGFSKFSEKLGPRLTLDWINDVMGALSNCVSDNHGVLVDTLGDELSGMWGAPVARTDQAQLACRAAVQMLQQLPAINRRWQNALDQPMDVGIGIHTGTARVGNIGSEKKFKYGPLGNTVHLARRTQRATRHLKVKILLTDATAAKLGDGASIRRLCRVTDKQEERPFDLFQLATEVSETWPELKRRYESALEAFERKDFPTATRLLAQILTNHPNDRPSLHLLSRINGVLGPENWTF